MTATDLFAEIADRITIICGSPYSGNQLTERELDCISDAVLLVVKRAKEERNGASGTKG